MMIGAHYTQGQSRKCSSEREERSCKSTARFSYLYPSEQIGPYMPKWTPLLLHIELCHQKSIHFPSEKLFWRMLKRCKVKTTTDGIAIHSGEDEFKLTGLFTASVTTRGRHELGEWRFMQVRESWCSCSFQAGGVKGISENVLSPTPPQKPWWFLQIKCLLGSLASPQLLHELQVNLEGTYMPSEDTEDVPRQWQQDWHHVSSMSCEGNQKTLTGELGAMVVQP